MGKFQNYMPTNLWISHIYIYLSITYTKISVNIRPTRLRKLPDQPIFEAFSQGIQPYVLDGDALLAGWAELAPPLGLSYMEPVGRPVTGARETVFFDKGFQQQRAVAIALLPQLNHDSANFAPNWLRNPLIF